MISVIITAYKDWGWIDECIESVKKQTFMDYDITLVSDGNPNLETFALKHNIKFLFSPKYNGSAAFNFGVKESSGDWIKWLHDDDFLPPNSLSDLYNARGDSDIVYGNAVNFKGNKQVSETIAPKLIRLADFSFNPIKCPIHGGTYLIKRNVFLEIGGIDESLTVANDFDFYYRLLINGYKFSYCNSIVYWFRLHENQITFKEKEVIEDVKRYLKLKHNK